jgi:hypothetical protein
MCGASCGTASCPTAACMTPGTPALGVFTTHYPTGGQERPGGCSVQMQAIIDFDAFVAVAPIIVSPTAGLVHQSAIGCQS